MGTLYGKREHLERFKPYKVRPATDAVPECWETERKCRIDRGDSCGGRNTSPSWGGRCESFGEGRRSALLAAYRSTVAYERTLGDAIDSKVCWRFRPALFRNHRSEALQGALLDRFRRGSPKGTPTDAATFPGGARHIHVDGNFYALKFDRRLGVESQADRVCALSRALQHGGASSKRLLAGLRDFFRVKLPLAGSPGAR